MVRIYKLLVVLVTFTFFGCSEESKEIELPAAVTGEWYKPALNTSWHWQLKDTVNESYDVDIYDIDLFDSDLALIESLQSRGVKVICYFSAGSYEDWREDKEKFPQNALGNPLDGWEGERWLDIRDEDILSIMSDRLDLAAQKGCDGVEPDNVDGYTNNTGFNLSSDDQLLYNVYIANEARSRGLSVGIKNDVNQIDRLEPYFDFVVNESCHEYNECDAMERFIDNNKPVFNAEYDEKYFEESEFSLLCQSANELGFQTLFLPLDLDDSFRYVCE